MSVTYAFLTSRDIDALSHVAEDVFDNPIHPENARLFLADPHHFIAAAQDPDKDGLIIGFVSASRQFHPDWEQPELFISQVGVAPPYQRRGIAVELMKMMLAKGKDLGCRCAWVATDDDNAAAKALYNSVGGAPPARHIHIDFDLH